jgi:two-component sensor histidine kinase
MVDLRAYLEELGEELEQGCADADSGRRVIVRAAPLEVPPEEATSIGILVSELVANACKYAYAPGASGDVVVRLTAMPFGGYRLDVEDRGRGMAADRPAEGTGLGSRLIAMMAARLGGRHGWQDIAPGTRFTLCVGKR